MIIFSRVPRSEKKFASSNHGYYFANKIAYGILNPNLEEEVAMLHMDTRKFSAHGFRKGSATNSLSRTTHLPSIVSVAR